MQKLTDKLPKIENNEEIIKDYGQAKSDKSNYEGTWESIRKIFAPYQQSITSDETDGGELDFSDIWTDSPIEAVRVFVSGLQTYLTPSNTKWVRLRMRDESLVNIGSVSEYLENVENEVIFTLNNSNFYEAISEFFENSVLYGTSLMVIDKDDKDRVRYKTLAMKNFAIKENSRGEVNRVYITEYLTLDQAIDKWGEKALHQEMINEYKSNDNKGAKYEFLYYITERKVRNLKKKDKLNMPYLSRWIDVKNKHTIVEDGFMEMPTAVHRFYKRSTSALGYSPCFMCLPSSRTLNKVAMTNLRGGAKFVDPAIAVPSRGFLTKLNANPNAINFYQKDVTKDSIFEIPGGRGVPFGVEYEDRLDNRLRRFLFNDIFKAMSGITKEMTVPEVNQIIHEALTQIGPAIGRFQTFLDLVITRTIGIIARGGYLPQAPDEIINSPHYEIEYTSYLAQMQKKGSINSVFEGLGILQQLAAYDPAVIDNLDADEAWKLSVDMTGLPKSISRNEVEVEEIRRARAEEQQAETQLNIMNEMSGAAKNYAEANK